jgi:hypothetical protein
MYSCEDDDKNTEKKTTVDKENLQGEITSEVVLEEGATYKLTGALIVKKGATLTIPAGTKISATAASGQPNDVRYIAVEQGAKLNVNGTASEPVVMTCDTKEESAWGGLVICGNAPTNKGENPTSEVANLTYGGTDKDDNSGSITYLRVEYSGYKYSDEKEFNGISLFGVGKGTKFENISTYEAGDDGIEFFGGTVNGINLVSINSHDDGIDFADGWQGNGTNWYVKDAAKSAIEGSNNGDDGNATPMTTTTLKNLTLIGMGEKPWYLKEGAGEQTIENVVIGGLNQTKDHAYFYVKSSDAEANARVSAGDIKITKVKFSNPNIADSLKASEGITVNEDATATGAGNGGAMPSWASSWAMPSDLGGVDAKDFKGEFYESVSLQAGVKYELTGGVVVKKGATLTIPAGTIIEATEASGKPNEVRYIAVEQGAKINIEGTKENPVVMTSAVKEAESWGGLVICGMAPTNKGDNPTSEVGNLTYGGTVAGDNSGSIKYLRVEYSGYKFSDDKEFNGISLFGVGSATKFEYVSTYEAGDDGIEFFGGTVTGNYLVSINAGDDGIDFADGWKGNGNNWYVKDAKKSAIEGSNNGEDGTKTPMTTTTLKNLTLIGMGEKPWYLKEGAGVQTIDNVVIGGLADGKTHEYFYISSSDAAAAARVTAGDITITNVKFNDANLSADKKAATGLSVTEKNDATGAGNGADAPDWASGWSMPVSN